MNPLRTLLVLVSLVGTLAANTGAMSDGCSRSAETRTDAAAMIAGRDWILKAENNICGLRDANQLSSPAVVDFQALMDATPEMKKVRDQKIDPNSPDGITLRTAAASRVTSACDVVRVANSHCSIWKEIKHKDGRAIPDVTDKVKALL